MSLSPDEGPADAGPTLSICIPIYNFGAFIGDTLRSIVRQIEPDIEVIIVDGASTDNTAEVIAPFVSDHANIRYHRLPKRGGIDADMAISIDLARGEYCWLFSGDDVMDVDAIQTLRRELASGPDVLLCTHRECRFDMTVLHERHPVLNVDHAAEFDLGSPQVRKRYFELALSSEAFFSFMSGLVIRRTTWRRGVTSQFMGSCWAHAARLLALVSEGLTVKYLPDPILNRRGDNDSFADRGVVKRYAIAIDGYHEIAAHVFGARSEEAFHIRRVIRSEIPLLSLLNAKVACHLRPQIEDIRHLDTITAKSYSDATWGNRAAKLTYDRLPLVMFRVAQRVWRELRGTQRPSRSTPT